MTDRRIEAAARELKRLFSEDEATTNDTWVACAKCIIEAVDAAAWRPMDEVHKDGGIALFTDGICVSQGGFDTIDKAFVRHDIASGGDGYTAYYDEWIPTRWQPLPKPPTPCK